MLSAGALDRRVDLQRATTVRDAFGGTIPTWSLLASVAASRADVSDRERLANAQVGAVVTTRFVIRWSPDVADLSAADRLIHEGRTYAIAGVKEAAGRRRALEITAAVRND